MSFLTQYGSLWGAIPQTSGRVFWVSPSATYTVEGRSYSASDGNDGLSPERALRTVAQAHSLCTASVNDVIVLLPGTHTVTVASLALSKAGVTIMGLPGGRGNPSRQRTSLTTSLDDQIANVTAANIEIAYLNLIPVTTKAAIDYTSAADGLYIHDCSIDMFTAAASTSTLGIAATTAAQSPSDILFENIYAISDGAQGAAISLGDPDGAVVQNCVFQVRTGTWAHAVSVVGVTSQASVIRNCHFSAQFGTMTVGILGSDMASTGQVGVFDCRFDENVTTPIEDFDAEGCNIAQNFRASADGSAEGGLLWSSTT
jgi:hypothetical protein